jgi:hypothetical protein
MFERGISTRNKDQSEDRLAGPANGKNTDRLAGPANGKNTDQGPPADGQKTDQPPSTVTSSPVT